MSDPDDDLSGTPEQPIVPSAPVNNGQRVGNAEREAAVSALKSHHAAGRITSQEYEERSLTAGRARTWDDLDPLFEDLPGPRPEPGMFPAPKPSSTSPALPSPDLPATAAQAHRATLLPEPWSTTIVSLTPLVAVILFFVTDEWLWFLAIPIMGILVYGPEGRGDSHQRKRDRKRNRD
jgi:hypothetical protein